MYEYFLVTQLGPSISIYCLALFGDVLLLTERIALPLSEDNILEQERLRGVCFGKGKVGLLFNEDTIVVIGLIGMFPSFPRAIECWLSADLKTGDCRWQAITNDMKTAAIQRGSPRIF
jgi:hypothetical protein